MMDAATNSSSQTAVSFTSDTNIWPYSTSSPGESTCNPHQRLQLQLLLQYRIHSNTNALSVSTTWSRCTMIGSKSYLKIIHFGYKNRRFHLFLMMKGGGLLGHGRLFQWIRYSLISSPAIQWWIQDGERTKLTAVCAGPLYASRKCLKRRIWSLDLAHHWRHIRYSFVYMLMPK